eukprot:CAMPEP_0172830152 /NCGR_PEP_ID=MMETSP1075-20121228/22031_1 /TAXON_ID=2916 /ORGANISM="Ceratium fusus, Strain PA161109" /LENGTH=635 /DNA_ID=CAMNT_0013672393 /DNA_START=252 /DNA_END=2159 /DNA_ORIENTATION=+
MYYAFLFLAAWLTFYVILPVNWLECKCVSWAQCSALTSFKNSTDNILNPYFEPSDVVERHMPYEEPPADPDEIPTVDYKVLEAKEKNKPNGKFKEGVNKVITENNKGGLLDVGNAAVLDDEDGKAAGAQSDCTFVHGRVVNKRRGTRISSALSLDAIPADNHLTAAAAALASATVASLQTFEQIMDPAVNKSAEGKHGGEAEETKDSLPAVHFFNVIQAGIELHSISDKPTCTHQTIDHATMVARSTELDNLHAGKERKLDTKLESEMYMCITDQLCGAVSIELKLLGNGTDGNSQFDSIVCQLSYQIVPKLGAVQKYTHFFEKNPISIKDDLGSSKTEVSKFYHDALKGLTPQEGMVKIQKMQKEKCMCDEPKADFRRRSCRTYQDVYGVDHAWCWVRKDLRVYKACEEKGIKLFLHEQSGRVWTEDICTRVACKCSGIGMYPIDPKDSDLDDTLLDPNKLNYGGSCQKWKKSDKQKWCYAGYDTVCPDRAKQFGAWGPANGIKQQWSQYHSKLPCDKEEQETLVETASSWCKNISIPAEIVLITSFVLYLPMIIIIFKFISNRCGDDFEVTDSFDVIITDSEDDEEDEWQAGSGDKEGKEGKKDKDDDDDDDDDERENAKPVTQEAEPPANPQ